ncbi:hypothetical protein [Prevotella sp. 10(H)]|uniref:hypothetical protein n=1 Tax=Prevotella sp. 10(H) TaxID=1158294 RepID=UPI0004A6FECE|nr:hypothetical protein [Prevotella sp. 10(H)]
MSILQKIESILFHFGFQECSKSNMNFLKLANDDYLIMDIFERSETADLFHVKFRTGNNPCNSEPYWKETIRLGFSPELDVQIIRDYIEKYK